MWQESLVSRRLTHMLIIVGEPNFGLFEVYCVHVIFC